MKNFLFFLFLQLLCLNSYAQFGAPQRISNDPENFEDPKGIESGDLDNDGDLDLVVKSTFGTDLAWLENLDGLGELSEPKLLNVPFNSFGEINDFELTDLNEDGQLDVVCVYEEDVFWFQNSINNTADFGNLIMLSTLPFDATQIKVVDLDGDGHLDLGIAGRQEGLGWFRSIDGAGNFENYQSISNQLGGVIDFADFDSDGDLDLVSTRVNGFTDKDLVWLRNLDGAGNFGAPVVIDTNIEFADFLSIGDISGDGKQDVILTGDWTDGPNSETKWYEYIEVGNFSAGISLEPDASGSMVDFADFDGDGDIDFVMQSFPDLILYLNDENTFENQQTLIELEFGVNDVLTLDINGDNFPDIISVARAGVVDKDQAIVLLNTGNGSFENPIEFISDGDEISFNPCRVFRAEDIDEDGFVELLYSTSDYDKTCWQSYKGTKEIFTNPRLINTDFAEQLQFVDVDNDGDKDFVAFNYDFRESILWYENLDGEFNFDNGHIIWDEDDYGVREFQVQDFDNDGDLDVFITKSTGFPTGKFWFENLDGQGNFSEMTEFEIPYNYNNRIVEAFVDFDNDGDNDIIGNLNDGIGWFENDNGMFLEGQPIIDGQDFFQISLIDINGDNFLDIVYYTADGQVAMHLNSGGVFGEAQIIGEILSGYTTFHFSDINNDGLVDLFYTHPFDNYYSENFGTGGFSAPLLLNQIPEDMDYFTTGDFDHDGVIEIVTHHKSGAIYTYENYTTTPAIQGQVFFDDNENGIKEANEIPMFNQPISIEPTSLSTLSNNEGIFKMYVGEGNYVVNCSPQSYYDLTSPANVQVNIDEDSELEEVFFGIKPNVIQVVGVAELTSAPTRCGFTVPFWIDYTNLSTTYADIELQLVTHELASFIESTPTPDDSIVDTLYWTIENVPPSHSGQIQLSFEIAGPDFIEEWILMTITSITTAIDGGDQYINPLGFRSQINCAYDPNDKLVLPNIPNSKNYTDFEETLDYTVRFQNTGTDTAFNVRIEDFLDNDLDWSTLKMVGCSHPCETTLNTNTGKLEFTFNNILLPDSTTNEMASHGYVRFKMDHKIGIPEFTYIENNAGIYFDFNPPILTNTVENIFVSQFPISLIINPPSCNGESDGSIVFQPDSVLYQSHVWSNGATENMLSSLSDGTYDLTVFLSNGEQLDTSIVLVESAINFTQTVSHVSCNGETDGAISLSGSGNNYTYVWGSDFEGPELNALSFGSYIVTITDEAGCFVTESIIISEPPVLDVGLTVLNEMNQEMNGVIILEPTGGTPPYSFTWNNFPDENENAIYSLSADEYQVTITDSNDCEEVLNIIVDQATSTFEIIDNYDFTIQPNPNLGNFTIKLNVSQDSNWELYIYTQDGKLVNYFDPNELNAQNELNIQDLQQGVYNIILFEGNKLLKSKMVIVH